MDGFHYYNLFETKGIEYLITIAFFLLLIPLWKVLNGKSPVPEMSRVQNALGTLSLNRLSIPKGILYDVNHTWAFLTKEGVARTGIDDFLMRALGNAHVEPVLDPGQPIKKGDLMARVNASGRTLNIYAPISGRVVDSNAPDLDNHQEQDTYKKGWVMAIEPSNWMAETRSFRMADQATEWMKNELSRFRDFVSSTTQKYSPAPSMIVLQDGGEPREQVMQDMPAEAWQEFQQSFLDIATEK